MGWLHYTERETLDTRIPALEAALHAHVEDKALEAAGRFGIVGEPPPTKPVENLASKTMAVFRSAATAPRRGI